MSFNRNCFSFLRSDPLRASFPPGLNEVLTVAVIFWLADMNRIALENIIQSLATSASLTAGLAEVRPEVRWGEVRQTIDTNYHEELQLSHWKSDWARQCYLVSCILEDLDPRLHRSGREPVQSATVMVVRLVISSVTSTFSYLISNVFPDRLVAWVPSSQTTLHNTVRYFSLSFSHRNANWPFQCI